jgi:ERCC4-related helicase
MHTKIITQQNDPNFLTHVIWSKTSLVVQHTHLELLWNLSYEILNKNKHNSRIIIYGKYKIVINSPEVCFNIKIQCAKVGFKNLIMFS